MRPLLYSKSGFQAIMIAMDWTYTIGAVTFGVLDIAVLVIVLIGAVSGCITGFARQVANLAGFVISIPVALLFTRPVAAVLSENTGLDILWASLASFVGICLVVFIIVALRGVDRGVVTVKVGIGLILRGLDFGFIIRLVVLSRIGAGQNDGSIARHIAHGKVALTAAQPCRKAQCERERERREFMYLAHRHAPPRANF